MPPHPRLPHPAPLQPHLFFSPTVQYRTAIVCSETSDLHPNLACYLDACSTWVSTNTLTNEGWFYRHTPVVRPSCTCPFV